MTIRAVRAAKKHIDMTYLVCMYDIFFFFRRPQIIVTAHYACTDVLSSCTLVHNTGWFKLHDGKLFPGQSPRRFFRVRP